MFSLQVMRAAVGTESEWTSAGPDLNRFVTYASGLFDRQVPPIEQQGKD